ncbi:TPA: hypothetical protein ACHOZC_003458 [Raoultella ornithinolytica]
MKIERLLSSIDGQKYEFMLEMGTPEMDQWVLENIGLSRCKPENALFKTKWFDYRMMHPLIATSLFTETYKSAYSRIMETHGREDFRHAPFRTGLKRQSYLEMSAANKTSLWKARQIADRYCCTYEYFISTILSAAASRLWDKLPRPQHLWQEDLLEIFERKFNARSKTLLESSVVSFGNMRQLCIPEVQRDYCEWILSHIKQLSKTNRIMAVCTAVFLKELIPEAVANQHFPDELAEAKCLI